MITIYGISNCDTVRRARKLLDEAGLEFRFHDFRKDGLETAQAEAWLDAVGAEVLINRRGTTWRRLSEGQRAQAETEGAAALLAAEPSLIKRPVTCAGGEVRVGLPKPVDAWLDWLAAV